MDAQRKQQFKTIFCLSKDMLDRAREDDWDAVSDLESRRRSLVTSGFIQPVSAHDGVETAAIIKEILNINQTIEDLARKRRDALGHDLQAGQTGKAATAAYRACAR